MLYRLLHRSGPGAGEEIEIPPQGLTLGRGEEADVRLPDRAASRIHCRLDILGNAVTLRDMGSKNRTLLNGLPVSEAMLHPGDVFQVGSHAFQVLEQAQADLGETGIFFVRDENLQETLSLPPVGDPTDSLPVAGRLSAAFRMAGWVAQEAPVQVRLKRFLETLLTHSPAWRAVFLLTETGGAQPGARIAMQAGGAALPEMTVNQAMVDKALRNGESLLFQNLAIDPTWPESETASSLFFSAACSPLPTPSGRRGVLYVDTLGGEGELAEADLHLIAVAGALAGAALASEEKSGRVDLAPPAHGEPRDAMVGESKAMTSVFAMIRKVAPTSSTVLIRGESGTGKELVARAIHRNGPRRHGPFVAVNCGAIPQGLLESELFGYEKGAFTGANRRVAGRFETAQGGVLFLDEIGELPLESQVKILRALEEKSVTRLGATHPEPVDIHLLAATNQDLEKAVGEGRFRRDLFYRLQVIAIDLPPLRQRQGDIPLLVDHFLESFRADLGHGVKCVEEDAMAMLSRYPWPGNVRELRNTIERALVLARSDTIGLDDISFLKAPSVADGEAVFPTLRDLEARHIRRALETADWNKSKAARLLGIERSTLYEKLKTYGIARPNSD